MSSFHRPLSASCNPAWGLSDRAAPVVHGERLSAICFNRAIHWACGGADWEEGRDRTIYRNRRRLVTWRWKSTGLVTRVGTPKTNVAKQSGTFATFFSLSLKASCLFWRWSFYTYVSLGAFHIDQIYTAGYKINIYFLRKQRRFRIFLRCDRWNIFCLEQYISCIGLDWLHFCDHSPVKRSFMSGNCVT